MKINNKGQTLVEIMVSMLLVAVAFLFGISVFVKAYRFGYLYSDVLYNVDTSVNILEKEKYNAIARIDGTANTFYSGNLGTRYNNPSGGREVFDVRHSTIATTKSYTGYDISGAAVNIVPTLIEVDYVGVFPVPPESENFSGATFEARVAEAKNDEKYKSVYKPKFIIALRTHYAYGMFKDIPS